MEAPLRNSQSVRGSRDSPLPDRPGAGRSSYQPFKDAKMRGGSRSSYAGSDFGSQYGGQDSPHGQDQNQNHPYPSNASSPTASTAGRQSFKASKGNGQQGGRSENRASTANGGEQTAARRSTKTLGSVTSSWAEGSVSVAEVHTQQDKESWHLAVLKTKEAEMEAARAKMALVRAERAGASVQQMQSRADEQMQLHDRILGEAEKVKEELEAADPSAFREAEGRFRSAHHDWNNFSQGIAELEAEAKQAQHDYETHLPLMETHRKKGRQLTEDYDENIRVVRGASEHLPQLQGLVQPSQDRAAEAGYEVEALIAELEKADALAAPLEEPALTARREHAALAQQLAIARQKQAEADQRHAALSNSYNNAVALERDLNEQRAFMLDQMETGRAQLAALEERRELLRGEILDGEQRLPQLRASGLGLPGQLEAADQALRTHWRELHEMQNVSMAAEEKYKELVDQADVVAVTGTDARALAHKHMGEFKEQNNAFQLHRDNHYALWLEAKEHGSLASTSATSAVEKMHEMIRRFIPADYVHKAADPLAAEHLAVEQ